MANMKDYEEKKLITAYFLSRRENRNLTGFRSQWRKWWKDDGFCDDFKENERYSQYIGCSVCEEWLNFSNFKVWYEKNIYGDAPLDLDKDILFKGNMVYGPDTVCFVPHVINTLFVNSKGNRGEYPIGVSKERDSRKFSADVTFMGNRIKLGHFNTAEQAFSRYKEYKEDLIRDMAEQYKEKIPDKVYQAMMKWEIEITD